MQKKLIALALASLAGSAFAQSNVTVYGVVDLGQAYVKSSGNGNNQGTVGRLDSNSTYLGFKGVEDLGNGLKAVFQLETGYNADNGTGWGSARDTYVGLTGNFGTVVAGNLTHPLRTFGSNVELMPGAAGFGTTASITGSFAGTKTGADDRASNALAYISPSFSGFTAAVAYVNGEVKTNDNTYVVTSTLGRTGVTSTTADSNVNSRQWQVSGQYANGPLWVGLGYHKAYDFAYTENLDAAVWRLAGTYTFPTNTKVTALWDNTKLSQDGDYMKRNAWSLGVAQGFGKNTVGLEYARSAKIKTNDGNVDDSSASIVSAIYSYELSKRTLVHARYSKLSNDKNVNYTYYNNPVANGVSTTAGADYSGLMLGLRHSF